MDIHPYLTNFMHISLTAMLSQTYHHNIKNNHQTKLTPTPFKEQKTTTPSKVSRNPISLSHSPRITPYCEC